MPQIPVDEFDSEPSLGDKVKVVGKVKSIEDGMVHISYDKVTIIDEKKRRKNRDNNDDEVDISEDEVTTSSDGMSADEALNTYFSQNQ